MGTEKNAGGFRFTKEYVGASCRMTGVSAYQVWHGDDFLGYVERCRGETTWHFDDGRKYGRFLYATDAWEGRYRGRLAAARGLLESFEEHQAGTCR